MARHIDSPLDEVCRALLERAGSTRGRNFCIPSLWNAWGYADFDRGPRGEISVNARSFIADCIQQVIFPARGKRRLAGKTLSQASGVRRADDRNVLDDGGRRRAGDWIRRSFLYSMMIRASTSWDHNGDGKLGVSEQGTFLKTIAILPLLRKMGVDVLYLLPVTKCSRKFRKGELGCPYSAKNFYELEPDLHDRLLGADIDVKIEFAALIEAAHALGMRVMVDLAPRTAARDSDLIVDHPDWFYWIDVKHEKGFGPPFVEGFPHGMPSKAELGAIMQTETIKAHMAKFRHAPNVTDPSKWKRFAARARKTLPRDLLQEIKREFGVITAPAFSDVVNDPQPPWSDVTFLRLYLDHPAVSSKHITDKNQAPYTFTDTIKASLFPGKKPNRALWKTLAGILPFYQKMGIDGARVDMGHALPPELQEMIINAPRRSDPDFCFLAEEFNHGVATKARRAGYNAIIGSSWAMTPRHREGELHRLINEVLPDSALPSLAASETPDTPRAVVRSGGKQFARMSAVLNCLSPNSIPLLNSGMEVLERQPMNLGLDACPPGKFALPKSDPYYGKLAYFDAFALHWTKAGGKAMVDLISKAAELRMQYIDTLADPKAHFAPLVTKNAKKIVAVGYHMATGGKIMLVVANIDFERSRRCVIEKLPAVGRKKRECTVVFEIVSSGAKATTVVDAGRLSLQLDPGDVKVIVA